jgi:DNA sulfur modification protein DndE
LTKTRTRNENVIARIALLILYLKIKIRLKDIKDAGGKEYSGSTFGDYYDMYLGLLCVHYGLYKTDKDIGRYIKMHVDEGLQL